MLPSAPTVSCHSLRSAPALTASSAGAAAAGLTRGRGTCSHPVVGWPVKAISPPLPDHCAPLARLFSAGFRRLAGPVALGGLAVAGCVTRFGHHRPGLRRWGWWCDRAWWPFRRLACPDPFRPPIPGHRAQASLDCSHPSGAAAGSGAARCPLPGGRLPCRFGAGHWRFAAGLTLRPGGDGPVFTGRSPCSGLAFQPHQSPVPNSLQLRGIISSNWR